MKNIFFVFCSLLLLSSCSKKYDECATISPAPPEAAISIVDSLGNSLIGEDNLYKPSEITLTRQDQSILLDFFENDGRTIIFFYYDQFQDGADYFLKLNSQETDVINLDLKLIDGFCFDSLEIETFLYNNQEILPGGGNLFAIQK